MKHMEIGKSKIVIRRITFGDMGIGRGIQWESNDDVLRTIETALDIGEY